MWTPPLQATSLLLCALFVGSCHSAEDRGTQTPAPLLEVTDAYELAGARLLPEVAPDESEGLHNVYQLSSSILSGSEPHGEAAFEHLAELGVVTILSVDGKSPDAELAAAHGMRYVHVPIRYNGIEDEELLRIAKTFRELDGPFFVHCFHGKHRGPAAAAVGRVVIDGAERERVVAEMRQWCGTSKKYSGLYDTLISKPIPSSAETAAYEWDFPASKPLEGFRHGMTEAPRLHDDLLLLSTNDWAPDPAHPDVDALNGARQLLQVFRDMNELPEVASRPSDFRQSMDASVVASEALVVALEKISAGREVDTAIEEANLAFDGVRDECSACHRGYRNRP